MRSMKKNELRNEVVVLAVVFESRVEVIWLLPVESRQAGQTPLVVMIVIVGRRGTTRCFINSPPVVPNLTPLVLYP